MGYISLYINGILEIEKMNADVRLIEITYVAKSWSVRI